MTKEERQKYNKAYGEANKDKRKEYYQANKDNIRSTQKEYREDNKDKLKEYRVNYYNTNHIFKLSCKIRSSIGKSLKMSNYKKNSRTAEILGCSFAEFKVHIEEQFPRDMTWDNSLLWEYDHIKPLASASNLEEVLELNHYTNFQPLWREDNRKKSDNPDWVKCPIKYAK